MTVLLTADLVRQAFLEACRAELGALKAGNVHVHASGHGMEVTQFEAAAAAAAPHIAAAGVRVGARIKSAVEASFAATGLNTNLGIVLLCAPLAAAAQTEARDRDLRRRLSRVLDDLDRGDARDAFQAIVRASPGGLGEAESQNVKAPPTVTLKQAMALAADRDRIANAYVTDYADVFDFALPTLAAARAVERDEADAIAALHFALLATFPDSHIARKYGPAQAEVTRAEAAHLQSLLFPLSRPDARERLLEFDRQLKSNKVNPGTTADFVVASLFADQIVGGGRHSAAV